MPKLSTFLAYFSLVSFIDSFIFRTYSLSFSRLELNFQNVFTSSSFSKSKRNCDCRVICPISRFYVRGDDICSKVFMNQKKNPDGSAVEQVVSVSK